MAVHGRYGQAVPALRRQSSEHPVRRNETNYCAHCQTGGKLLADRSLSRLPKQDWPRRLEELEALKTR